MANPQLENGYTRIANEIIEALAKLKLTPYEWRVLMVILRKTFGYGKPEDAISLSQFKNVTNIQTQHIHRTLISLINKGVIRCNGIIKVQTHHGYQKIHTYQFQKDYSLWKTYQSTTTDGNTTLGNTMRGITTLNQGTTTGGNQGTTTGGYNNRNVTLNNIQKKVEGVEIIN